MLACWYWSDKDIWRNSKIIEEGISGKKDGSQRVYECRHCFWSLAQLPRLNTAPEFRSKSFKIPRFYHISPILCTLHWLPVEFRIHFKIITITFKAIHGQAPVYLQELIGKREEERYNLRSCAMGIMLQTPSILTKKTLGDLAFLAAAPKLWNGLPSQIRNEPNFNRFKGLLKTHLFRLAFY